jgi:hypothetical protein
VRLPAFRPLAALIALAFLVACAPAAAPPRAAPAGAAATASASPATGAPAQPAPAAAPVSPALHLVQGHQGSAADAPAYIALERGYYRE